LIAVPCHGRRIAPILEIGMYKIFRNFSIASLASILLMAALLTLIYRQVVIKSIVHLGEEINVELAQTALNSVKSQLVDYLVTVGEVEKAGAKIIPINAGLEQAIQRIMTGTQVVRIKIYNRHGIVVFSTKAGQTGIDQRDNAGFVSAIGGKVASKLIYRDDLNPLDQATEEDNLIQTYLPVHQTVTSPVQGVFEIYTDVNPLVAHAQYTQIVIATGVSLLLVLLYLALLAIVRRAEKIIASQQNTIRERTETLEILSAQLLSGQENEKKRIANYLHEDMAQTLSAIKYQVENTCRMVGQKSAEENSRALNTIVSAIQQAIQQASALAMDLRPPSLDELGIVATVDWYCRQFQVRHPEIRVEQEITLKETDVSHALKIILYRVIQETLDNLVKHAQANYIRISLDKNDDSIVLAIEDSGRLYQPGETAAQNTEEKRIWFYAIEERAVLSGGVVSTARKATGGYRVLFTWPAQP